jgi:sugar phosphate permease
MGSLHDRQQGDPSSLGERAAPTHVRFRVLAVACVLAVITYIHRVGFATAAAEIKQPLGLSDSDLGSLMAAFMIAYGLFEMPWGLLSDRFGVRAVLVVAILGGSALTAALPLVALLPAHTLWVLGVLLLLRFVFGAFQAGTFPAVSRMMADWIPVNERGGAQGLLWMASRMGGAAAPSLLVWLFALMDDWKAPVVLTASFGMVWALLFWPWFRNRPEDMPQVNNSELVLIARGRAVHGEPGHGGVPWLSMLESRSVLALCAMYGFLGYSGNFFLTLLPAYLKDHRHLDSQTSGFLTSLPFACGVAACLAGGHLSDLFIRHWGVRWGRRSIGAVGLALGAVGMMAAPWAKNLWMLGGALCLTFVGNDLAMGPAWAAAADIGGRHTGVLSGAMNMTASLTAAVGAKATGHLFARGYLLLPFVIYSCSYLLGALSWLGVDVTQTLTRRE